MTRNSRVQLRTNSVSKRKWQKWASRRNITLSALVSLAVSEYVARNPLPGWHDEDELAQTYEVKNDET